MRQAIGAFLFWTLAAAAQQVGQNTQPGGPGAATFTAGTQLVVETVAVTDKKGAPVEGLTAKDFTVTEDGVPQAIRVFEYQELRERTGSGANAQSEQIHIYDKLGRTQISSEAPGDNRYKDRRLLALYFDMTAMPPGRPIARPGRGAELHPDSDDLRRPGGHPALLRRRRRSAAGFHRRPRPPAEHYSDDDRRRRTGLRRIHR